MHQDIVVFAMFETRARYVLAARRIFIVRKILNIVNEVIDRHLRDADEECQVNWIRGMFSGGHEEECVRDVDAIMSIVAKHADLAEAVVVVRELVDRGGSSAANAVRTWCAAHADLPNATALSGMLDDMSKGKSIGTPSN